MRWPARACRRSCPFGHAASPATLWLSVPRCGPASTSMYWRSSQCDSPLDARLARDAAPSWLRCGPAPTSCRGARRSATRPTARRSSEALRHHSRADTRRSIGSVIRRKPNTSSPNPSDDGASRRGRTRVRPPRLAAPTDRRARGTHRAMQSVSAPTEIGGGSRASGRVRVPETSTRAVMPRDTACEPPRTDSRRARDGRAVASGRAPMRALLIATPRLALEMPATIALAAPRTRP